MKTTLKLTLLFIALNILSPTSAWGKEPDPSPSRGIGYGRRIGVARQCQQSNPYYQSCDNYIGNERDRKAGSATPLNRSTGQGRGQGQGYRRGVGRQECQDCGKGENLGRRQAIGFCPKAGIGRE